MEQEPAHWELEDTRLHADCRVFDVLARRLKHPARPQSSEFFIIDAFDWVVVVATTTNGEMLLVNQFRYGSLATSWEPPGGCVDADEDPVAAGLRELREETGYGGGQTKVLGQVLPNPALQDNRCTLLWVHGITQQGLPQWDEHEELQIRLWPIDDVYRMARAGAIEHSIALNALFLFEPYWRAGLDPTLDCG